MASSWTREGLRVWAGRTWKAVAAWLRASPAAGVAPTAWALLEAAEALALVKVAAAFLAGPLVCSAKQVPVLWAALKAFRRRFSAGRAAPVAAPRSGSR